jgi:hypothetical protein
MTAAVAASKPIPSGEESGWTPATNGHDALRHKVSRERKKREADATFGAPLALRWLSAVAVPASSRTTTSEAKISTAESSENPASATERASGIPLLTGLVEEVGVEKQRDPLVTCVANSSRLFVG